ncbi:FecR domain-containing protein (plasmid) [Sphingobium sp. V4]|uniref:FecR family protein n=1 Tax=Sphingobium sp. V4 TaxID=3038927 RepID=UPI0025582415|nr:FecR domain-containing protein [Sphingobium sp. V4]WIW90290.1 FecR domain-containing protein [Sphingobium sp. V4]
MIDGRASVTARDRRVAQKWVLRMLDEPERHAQALADWIAEKPARYDLYLGLLSDVQEAGEAGALLDLPSARPPVARPLWTRAVPAVAAASLLCGLIASAALFQLLNAPAPHVADNDEVAAPLVTKLGEVRSLKLADGSQVVLDTDTAMSVSMTSARREIVLKRGRARFVVAHDKSRPFFVRAGGLEVRATGTIFDVLYRNNVAVHLIEGGVEVQFAPQGKSAGGKLLLRPGQILALRRGQAPQSVVIPARRSDQQWVSGVKSFDNVPIREVIVEANSYSETKIELVPPSLGDREIFADIHIRDIERVAEAISGFLDLGIDRSKEKRLILTAHK